MPPPAKTAAPAARQSRAARQSLGGAAGSAEGTIADQLAKLAGLLQQGLLTREEFDRLKARLIS